MKKISKIYGLFWYVAIFGNIIYFFWLLYNGIDEGFKGSIVAIIAPLGMMLLLVLNVILLCHLRNFKNN